MPKHVIEYVWTEAEYAEEIEALNSDPDWVKDHEPETAEEFVSQYARSWVGPDRSIVGLDYVSPSDIRLGHVLTFATEAEAKKHIATLTDPGTFIVHEWSA